MSKINMYCLPFAGGSRHSYNGYEKIAPSFINVVPLELPGRGVRFREHLLTSVDAMCDDVYAQIEKSLSSPYVIYGHSMGTLIGYLLTKRILKEKKNPPVYLFFTGCTGPSVRNDEPIRYNLPKTEFIAKLRELGGSPDEILDDPNLMDFFEPILRADFHATETYLYQETTPFDIPIFVAIGKDENITVEKAMTWKKETTAPVEVKEYSGKHFFIYDHLPAIMNQIINKLKL